MSESRIRILPPEVSEKIAAGEVIERPASAVKELVENALDAGATRIQVEIEAGGKQLIRVTDDGGGMTPEEAELAILRHATSKLQSADDLFVLHTLGFRGEALPSIAAVAHLEIVTRTPEAETGTRVAVEGGVVVAMEAVAAPVGTMVTVQRLYFNTPARQKFLRSDTTEAAHITEMMQRLALVNHRVTFRLTHDGREVLLSPGSDEPLNAVVAVWGRGVARDLLRMPRWGDEALSVTGFAGKPSLTRANRHSQLVFVNGRPVRTPLFYRALDEAYRASMPSGRHPLVLAFVAIARAAVDVNVHPSKVEVRFRDDYAVYAAILNAVRETLSTGVYPEAPAAEAASVRDVAAPAYPPPAADPFTDAEPPTPAGTDDAFTSPAGPATRPPTTDHRPPTAGGLPFADAALGEPARGQFPRPSWTPRPSPTDDRPAALMPPAAAGDTPAPTVAARPAFAALQPLGQVRDLFVLAEAEGKLWIIDQHVAHERILFDRLTRPDAPPEPAEPLLIPVTLTLDPREMLALQAHQDALTELGFVVEPFGPQQFVVRAIPHSLLAQNYEQALHDMIDELADLSNGGHTRLRRDQLAMAAAGRACKAAIKAGQPLSQNEVERMLEELRHTRNPYTCPHGRPIFLIYSPADVAALFGGQSCEE
jgi:DNA mismatch repair protein MutL